MVEVVDEGGVVVDVWGVPCRPLIVFVVVAPMILFQKAEVTPSDAMAMLKKILFDDHTDENTSINSLARRLCLSVLRCREYSHAETVMLLQGEPMVHCSSSVQSFGDPRTRSVKRVKQKDGTLSGTRGGDDDVVAEVVLNSYDKYMREVLSMREHYAPPSNTNNSADAGSVDLPSQDSDVDVADVAGVEEDYHRYKSYDEYTLRLGIGEKGIGECVPNYRFKQKCTWPQQQ